MTFDDIKNNIPDYAKDIRLNLSSLLNDEETLNAQQKWGTFMASALACNNANLANAAAANMDESAATAAKAAHAIMSMNNIYYRFVHLSSNKEYQTMRANLRMNIMADPGVDKVDFELWSLAVSAINGCGMCIDAHEKVLIDAGMTKEQIQYAVRVAAVVHAASAVD